VPSGSQGQLAAEDIKKVIEEKIETANRQQMDEMKKLIMEMGGKQMQQSQKFKDQQA
jgi:glucose-6-phosphate dehydrogenase assembly protein OpcA